MADMSPIERALGSGYGSPIERALAQVQQERGEVIWSSPEGRVYRKEGQLHFVSEDEGYSTSDPAAVDRIMAGSTVSEEVRRSFVLEPTLQQHPYASRAAQAIHGAPFVGTWTDEAIGMVSPQAAANVRLGKEAMQTIHPGQATALELGGAVAGSLPLALATPGLPGTSPAARAAWGGAFGGGAGFAEGVVSGAGLEDDRARGAKERGFWGGTFGIGLGALGPTIARGFENLIAAGARKPVKEASRELGVSQDAVRVIRSIIDTDNIEDARKIIDQMGGEAFLADLSPQAQAMLDAVMQFPSKAGTAATKAIDERASVFNQRMDSVLDETLGVPVGRVTASRTIRGVRRDETTKLYEEAYTTPINYASPEGMALEELMGRLPSGMLSDAVKSANERLVYNGINAGQMVVRIGEDGREVLTEVPNVAQWDYLKRAFDRVKQAGTDRLTGEVSPDAVFAGNVARDIRTALANAVPVYGRAVESSADTLGKVSAVNTGYSLLRPQFTRDMAAREIRLMSGPEKRAAAQGVREYIDDTLANVRAVVSDPNVEARQVSKLINDLSSNAARDKIRLLVGPTQANKIFAELERSSIALNLRAATARNTATAVRTATHKAIAEITGLSALETVARGSPQQATQKIIQAMTGYTDEAMQLRLGGIYADIAEALVGIKGEQADRALRLMQHININEPITRARAKVIADAVAATFIPMQQVTTKGVVE